MTSLLRVRESWIHIQEVRKELHFGGKSTRREADEEITIPQTSRHSVTSAGPYTWAKYVEHFFALIHQLCVCCSLATQIPR